MSNTSHYHVTKSLSFADSAAEKVDWIWEGYLARGAMTLLTSQWKAGKTTLVSVLLKRLATGEPLAGLPTSKTAVTIVSEEGIQSWRRRHERLQFGENLNFLCRPFSSRPTRETWERLIDQLLSLGFLDL
jgi:predicted ATP-dependent serine protease